MRFEHAAMGTSWSVVLYARDAAHAERAVRAAFAVIDEIDRLASDYDPTSELAQLSGEPVDGSGGEMRVSPLLCELLTEALDHARATGGAFDPTLGRLTRLWRRARRQGELPSPERLAAARATVGFEFLTVDSSACTVRFLREGMQLDLGGIAKGQALDRALAELRAAGIESALVEGGGDLRAGAAPPGADAWIVALESDGMRVRLVEAGMATSGDAYRGFDLEGSRYSHLIDRRSGAAVVGPHSATVIASTAAEADAFATALCAVGAPPVAAWFSPTSGRAARFVAADASLWRSPTWSSHEIADAGRREP